MKAPATYKYCDAISLPAVDADHIDSSRPACVFLEAPKTIRRFSRGEPVFHDDPDGVGLFSGFAKGTITYPPAFIATARNARLCGFRTILCENGLFFNDDSTLDESQRRSFLSQFGGADQFNEETGLKPADWESFEFDPAQRIIQRVKGAAVLLSSAEPSNYGSWLFRTLPKLYTIAQVRLRHPVRYLVWAEVSSFQDYLRLVGIAKNQIIPHDPRKVYHLDQVIVPSIRNNQAYLDPESRKFYANLRDRFGGPQQPGAKIYVSRLLKSQSDIDGRRAARVMLNEVQLIQRLAGLGFRIISPELLSVSEQILAFSSAEIVVGPSGSGMFNVVYCHPGTKIVDIESEPHWIHAHWSLFASCGLQFGIFVGSATDRSFVEHHQPWTVNIEALVSRVESFSRG